MFKRFIASASGWIAIALSRRGPRSRRMAERLAQFALHQDSNCVAACLAMQWCEVSKESHEKVLGWIDRIECIEGPRWETSMWRASMLDAMGRNKEALHEVESVIDKAPQDYDVLRIIGLIYLNNDRLVEAEKVLRRNIGKSPTTDENAVAHYTLAQCLRSQGCWNEAIRELRRSLRLSPDDPTTLREFAYCLMHTGEYEKAQQELIKAEYIDPGHVYHYTTMCELFLLLGRLEDAEHDALTAVDIEPENVLACERLVQVRLAQGAYEDAQQEASRLIELAPYAASSWIGVAAAALYAGDLENAHTAIRRAIDLAPESSDAWIILEHSHSFCSVYPQWR